MVLFYGYLKPTRICMPVPLYHCFGMVLGRYGLCGYFNGNIDGVLTSDFSFSYNSLASIVFGATAVYPSPSFNAHASLMAVQDEK